MISDKDKRECGEIVEAIADLHGQEAQAEELRNEKDFPTAPPAVNCFHNPKHEERERLGKSIIKDVERYLQLTEELHLEGQDLFYQLTKPKFKNQ